MWNANGNGTIDFQELLRGLEQYLKASDMSSSEAEKDALMIMGHNNDSNQALDKEEFAYAMANNADYIKKPLHELFDFMVIVGSKETGRVEEFEKTCTEMNKVAFVKPSFKGSDLGKNYCRYGRRFGRRRRGRR